MSAPKLSTKPSAGTAHCSSLQAPAAAAVPIISDLRHNAWNSNRISDLQRGERFANMDFMLFSLSRRARRRRARL
ncbi:hypothetical protein C8J57DRAFT_1505069 [Mycena rebaudengoi]|nr:hypothetical protein C8J57DRAFT_1505069 [Mycena rebaudengoi]